MPTSGSAVSGSFLFIIGAANSVILWRILRRRRMTKQRHAENRRSLNSAEEPEHNHHETSGLMMRILGPVTTFVNKPWKMYPVGVLFGFSFDTASSVALLAVTALARKGSDGQRIAQGDIVILPFLFTAGMTIVDSADSVLMLYSYAGFTDRNKWAVFKHRGQAALPTPTLQVESKGTPPALEPPVQKAENEDLQRKLGTSDGGALQAVSPAESPPLDAILAFVDGNPAIPHCTDSPSADPVELERAARLKLYTMSELSIVLTLMSILVALSISLITIMGLIGERCKSCQTAADAGNGGGLAGSWWRGWAKANNNLGYIGAAIVGGFIAVVVGWYTMSWFIIRLKKRGPSTTGREE